MFTFTLAACALALGQFPNAAPPPPVELFAKEAWYKDAKGPEQAFVGVLKKADRGKGIVGFGRFNPFRLEMEGGKVREVYVGAQGKRLDPYVGKRIKLVGKAVDMEVEGRMHHEIWAATLFLLSGVQKDTGKDGPKIHAKTPARVVTATTVIKSAEQLGKLQNMDADKASENLAKQLKVKSIDWTKQMVIVVSGGQQRTGGYSIDVTSLNVKDGKLVVNWKLNSPKPGAIVIQVLTNPTLTILVDRFDGDVIFDPKAPPAGGGKKLGGS